MMSERFYLGNNDTTICDRSQGGSDGFNMLTIFKVVDLLNEQQSTIQFLQDEIDELKKDIDIYEYEEKKHSETVRKLYEENEQLRMKLKGDDYIMVSEMLSNLRKTGICDGCKNKDKPVEWYLERGFSITEQICDLYEPE